MRASFSSPWLDWEPEKNAAHMGRERTDKTDKRASLSFVSDSRRGIGAENSEAARIYSKILDAELWIAATEEAAEELRHEGVELPILLPAEAEVLGNLAQADARELFSTLAKVQRVKPGSRLRSIVSGGLDA